MQIILSVITHLVIVGSSAFDLPSKLSQHKGLFKQLSAHIYMTIDPAASKLNSPLIIDVGQPAIWPQMYGSKVNAGGLVIPKEVTPLVHGVIWVVRQQVCKHSRQAVSPHVEIGTQQTVSRISCDHLAYISPATHSMADRWQESKAIKICNANGGIHPHGGNTQ